MKENLQQKFQTVFSNVNFPPEIPKIGLTLPAKDTIYILNNLKKALLMFSRC